MIRSPVLLAGTALFLGTAFGADTATWEVRIPVDQRCNVDAPDTQSFDPASTAVQPGGTVAYECNFVGSATLRLWSENAGQVISPAAPQNGGTAQIRAYDVVFDGTALGQLTSEEASATPVTRAVGAVNIEQLAATTIQLHGAASVAGTYSDTLFVSIAP